MINLTTGSPASGMSHNVCTPPVENGDPSRAVPVGDPGQGACILRVRLVMAHLTGALIDYKVFSGDFRSARYSDAVRFGCDLDAPDSMPSGGVRSFACGDDLYLIDSVYRS